MYYVTRKYNWEQLPWESYIARNTMPEIDLDKILSQFPSVSFGVAYGSGVFKQHGYQGTKYVFPLGHSSTSSRNGIF